MESAYEFAACGADINRSSQEEVERDAPYATNEFELLAWPAEDVHLTVVNHSHAEQVARRPTRGRRNLDYQNNQLATFKSKHGVDNSPLRERAGQR